MTALRTVNSALTGNGVNVAHVEAFTNLGVVAFEAKPEAGQSTSYSLGVAD